VAYQTVPKSYGLTNVPHVAGYAGDEINTVDGIAVKRWKVRREDAPGHKLPERFHVERKSPWAQSTAG